MNRREQHLSPIIRSLVATWIERNDVTPSGTLITVTHVNVSPGRAHAHVFISALPNNKAAKAVTVLRRQISKIQQYVNKHIAARPVPRIFIEHDPEPAQLERIERLITKTKR